MTAPAFTSGDNCQIKIPIILFLESGGKVKNLIKFGFADRTEGGNFPRTPMSNLFTDLGSTFKFIMTTVHFAYGSK